MAKKMKFVPESLNLPLFCLERTSLQQNQPEALRNYFKQKAKVYANKCVEAANKKNILDKRPVYECKQVISKVERSPAEDKPWQLAPNQYEMKTEPFSSRKGIGGAYWSRIRRQKEKTTGAKALKPKVNWQFFDRPNVIEQLNSRCNKHKGVFHDNLRIRRGTGRVLVSNLLECYRPPGDPDSTTYYSQRHEIQSNLTKPIPCVRPNPYRFLPSSSVPLTYNAIHPKNESFKPGPGRYEIRSADILVEIQREKRNKFRGLAIKSVNENMYYSPNLRQVPGGGHTRLLKNAPKKQHHSKEKTLPSKAKPLQMALDPKHRKIINKPKRQLISFRDYKLERPKPKIRFFCTSKLVVRKQLKFNMQIAFSSGQERFKGSQAPAQLTNEQMREIRRRLPPERRLRNYPIIRKSTICNRLNDVPDHMKPLYQPMLRKKLFKFSPLPAPKVLVREEDTRGELADKNYKVPPFFGKPVNPKDFFKSPEDIDIKYRHFAFEL